MSPELELIPINIGNINDGAMIEGFAVELQKVLANIADINTPATSSRKITLELTIKPHADRVTMDTEFRCASRLAPIETHTSMFYMGKASDGSMVAFANDPRQMPLWSAPAPQAMPAPIEFKSPGK